MHSSGQSLRLGFQDHWLAAGRLGQYATDWGLGDWVPCSVVLDFGRFHGVIDLGGFEGFYGSLAGPQSCYRSPDAACERRGGVARVNRTPGTLTRVKRVPRTWYGGPSQGDRNLDTG